MILNYKKILLGVSILSVVQSGLGNIIYILPPCGYHNEKLFDIDDPYFNRNNGILHFYTLREELRKKGYDLKTTLLYDNYLPQFAGLIACDLPADKERLDRLASLPKNKLSLLLFEPPTVVRHYYDRELHKLFGKVFIMLDDWVDSKHYFKLYFPQPSLQMVEQTVPFKDKKLCTLIAGNKTSNYPFELYSERKKVLHFFEPYQSDFDFYGSGWSYNDYSCYKGAPDSKLDVLKKYKFCICYENTCNIMGYVTEKIFDCLLAGCVPVYWGACNIADFVPQECFIAQDRFKSLPELYEFLKNMTQETHDQYVQAMKAFFNSKKAHLFSQDYFVRSMMHQLLGNV